MAHIKLNDPLFSLWRHKIVDNNLQRLLAKNVLEDSADFFPFQAINSAANFWDGQLIHVVFALM